MERLQIIWFLPFKERPIKVINQQYISLIYIFNNILIQNLVDARRKLSIIHSFEEGRVSTRNIFSWIL